MNTTDLVIIVQGNKIIDSLIHNLESSIKNVRKVRGEIRYSILPNRAQESVHRKAGIATD